MGHQPEDERATTPQPLSDDDSTADQDVEVEAALDLALRYEAVEPFVDEIETPLAMCQICMEFYGSREVVRNVCGAKCLAEVCPSCMIQHLTASVYSFYPGVLPKVRCPVCLVLLNKVQWKKLVLPPSQQATDSETSSIDEGEAEQVEQQGYADGVEMEPSVEGDETQEEMNEEDEEDEDETSDPDETQEDNSWMMDHSYVLDKYEILCRQSCGFQSPCCHNTEYTMLARVSEDDANVPACVLVRSSQLPHLAELEKLCRDYCFHRAEVAQLYEFIVDKFDEYAEDILDAVLSKTLDDERRANLLLLHLFHRPNTYTHCCEHAVCFKCKAAHHHDGKCDDFVVDENVLDCPGCRVTLVKVDGCDSVTCVCGYNIEWPVEMEKQRLQRKQLAPSDSRQYAHWSRWVRKMDRTWDEIEALEANRRSERLQRMIDTNREVLQRLVDRAVRRARLNILIRESRDRLAPLIRAHLKRRKSANSPMVKASTVSSSPCGPPELSLARAA